MYKEEGNEWLKKKTTKEVIAARDQYTYALEFVFKAMAESIDEDKRAELSLLGSVILSNRAMTGLLMQNYGMCVADASQSLRGWPDNVKAHYRKSKGLFALKKYPECMEACVAGLAIDSINKEILSIKQQCAEEMAKLERLQAEKVSKQLEWRREIVDTFALASREGVRVRAPESALPPQLTRASPHLVDGAVHWSMLLLCPQTNKVDVVQSAAQEDMVAEYLALVYPEESCPSWDRSDEYHVSRLCAYIRVDDEAEADSAQSWLSGWERLALASTSGDRDDAAYVRQFRRASSKVRWLEFHLGISVLKLLRCAGHVAEGGVLHLILFPRDNAAHVKFIKDAGAEGDVFGHIDPNGVVSVPGSYFSAY